jgi:hypothetical protein
MRGVNCSIPRLFVVASLSAAGCAYTRDVSTTAEYKPWIGKTVPTVGPRGYNVFSPTLGPYFMEWADGYGDYPIVAKIPEGYPVVIEAAKRTEGRYLMGNIPFTHDQLILSMEHPEKKNQRIRVWSEINYVEPFKDKKGEKWTFPEDSLDKQTPATESPDPASGK